MISQYFISSCVRPIYLLNTKEDAMKCGLWTGIMYALIISIIVFLYCYKYVFLEKDWELKKLQGGFSIMVLLSVWIALPLSYRASYGTVWEGYSDLLNDLTSQGLSKNEALKLVANVSQTSTLGSLPGVGGVFSSSAPKGTNNANNTYSTSDNSNRLSWLVGK